MIRRLIDERHGATLVEFALIAPVMLLLLMGLFDLCYRSYAQAVLTGAVQQAARRGTLEGNSGTDTLAKMDAAVISQMRPVANNLTWQSSRKFYRGFASIAPESFDDANHNNRYDPGECFSDINGNKRWDTDPGNEGQGGANDVTVYTMRVTYPRLFPLSGLMGLSSTQEISSSTALKNQPYGSQGVDAPETICT